METELKVERTVTEIDTVLDQCTKSECEGTNFPGMTYEQGIKDALNWVFDKHFEELLED